MQKPLKKIYLTLAALAVLASTGVTVWLYYTNYPYNLVEDKAATESLGGRIDYYKDMDDDGCSERFVFYSNKAKKYHNLKIYRQLSLHSGVIIDQYNFRHPLNRKEIYYQDLTGDGMKEVVVFSHDDEAIYLSVIDLAQNKYLTKERIVLPAPSPIPFTFWDVEIMGAVFADVNADGHKDIIFTVHSGHSKSPRGIFILDLFSWKIIKGFPFSAGSARILKYDLTGDGVGEFILSTTATDNMQGQGKYSDDKSWLMVFNQQLNFLFEPKAFGGRFSSIMALPFRFHGQNMLLVHAAIKGKIKLLLVNKNGEIIKTLDTKTRHCLLIKNSVYKKDNFLIRGPLQSKFDILDSLFTLNSVKVSPELVTTQLRDFRDLTGDGRPEFLANSLHGLYVLSEKMETLAFFPWNDKVVYHHSYYYSGKNALPYLSIITKNTGYAFCLLPNPHYSWLPFLFFTLVLIFGGLFYVLHIGINKIRIYASYLLFSLRGSDNAIVLLNHRGRIITFNAKVNTMLQLSSSLASGQHYTKAFEEKGQIVKIIEESIQKGRQIKKEFSFEEARDAFIGEATVTPFTSYFKFINAYLIEIKDSTKQVLMERQQNWQRNVRKMVHDIKNPLAGVQLKMQTLYFKIVESMPNVSWEIKEEFEQAYSELKRIRNISKDFLKFSDLDDLQIEDVHLQEICDQCMEHFYSFRNDYLSIQTHYADDLPKKVSWDVRQIELLVHIIVENAIDALNGRGEILISIKPSPKVLNTKTPHIEFRISDNGPGIPDKYKNKIFEPHFSTKPEGTGMGLVFAKHIIQQHGGSIEFFSAPNSGTEFVITLPVQAGQNR